MNLKILLSELEIDKMTGDCDVDIYSISYDSRKVKENSLFVCVKGTQYDGHDFISEAIENGACAVIVEENVNTEGYNIPIIKVMNSKIALAHIASRFYNNPSKEMELIGVTGTNGKTTVVHYIRDILESYGKPTGVIGTLGYEFENMEINIEKNTPTTPENLELQQVFRKFKNNGAENVVMEVTSAALHKYRVEGCKFKIAVFTNLSQDHLDEHKTLENYKNEKMKLFNMCEIGVLNADDKVSKEIMEKCSCKVITYGIEKEADITAKQIEYNTDKVSFEVNIKDVKKKVWINMPGKFTVYNVLSAIGACYALGININDILNLICHVKKVCGRLEKVENEQNKNIIVDYAHTPVALEKLLFMVKKLAKGRIILVFGCGGDRDKSKRSLMGMIAGVLSNYVIITSDNPRTENPEDIIRDIEEGMEQISATYEKVTDRREAIKRGIEIMKEDDLLIIAGKGHEDYQIIGKEKIHFDDKEVIKELLQVM